MYVWGDADFAHNAKGFSTCKLRFPTRYPDELLPPLAKAASAAAPTEEEEEGGGAVPFYKRVKSISVGARHIVAIIDGVVMGMGANDCSQLGKLCPPATYCFTALGFPAAFGKPAQVCCAARTTFVRTEDENVFAVGDNSNRQIGVGPKALERGGAHPPELVTSWTHVPVLSCKKMVCGDDTSYALCRNGQVWSWGRQSGGALGHGTTGVNIEMATQGKDFKSKCLEKPTLVQWFINKRVAIVDLSAAKSHFIALSDDGEVYTCGTGSYGRLGLGDTEDSAAPCRVEFPPVRTGRERTVQVAAGQFHSVMLRHNTEIGSVVYVCGRPTSNYDNTSMSPMLLNDFGARCKIRKVVAGEVNTFVVHENGILQVWGAHAASGGVGLMADDKKMAPTILRALLGRPIVDVFSTKCLFVALSDDALAAPGSCVHPFIPERGRYVADRYEEATTTFFERCFGGDRKRAESAFAAIPQPQRTGEFELPTRGAHSLHKGSKVRLWMTNVYALGTIADTNIAGFSKNQFQISWVRDDWEDEIIELLSDDETLDEDNGNRWQSGWFFPDKKKKKGV